MVGIVACPNVAVMWAQTGVSGPPGAAYAQYMADAGVTKDAAGAITLWANQTGEDTARDLNRITGVPKTVLYPRSSGGTANVFLLDCASALWATATHWGSIWSATPYATCLADMHQHVQNPSSQGWTDSAGGLSQGVDDTGTLAWILNDNSTASRATNPTMYMDCGAADRDDTTPPSAAAATRFARVFGSHMVLQRGEPVAVFGSDTAAAGQAISVAFAGQTKTAMTDSTGKWRVTLDPLTTSTVGQSLTVTGSTTTTLTDILVGEVWLAAGQSNMNFTAGASSTLPKAANFPLVRMCNWDGSVGTGASQVYGAADYAILTPDHFFIGTWQVMDATTVGPQSGVAWFYASELADALKGTGPGGSNVPVGVLDISIGGTSTEAYIPPSVLLADPVLRVPFQMPKNCPALGQWTAGRINQNLGTYTQADLTRPHPHPYAPGFLYQAGIEPILPFTFKGAIWYQGESNAEFTDTPTGTSVSYGRSGKWISDYQTHVMEVLVDSWCTAFGKPDFPFYQVMLPRINAPNRAKWPWYREAQQRLDAARDNVETAVITEFGVDGNVHPTNKEAVGVRLARIARARLYGETSLEYSGPRYRRQTISGNKVILEFDHTGGGLVSSDGGALRQFEIAGPDRNFVAATATIAGNTVQVSAAGVPLPVAVRFAWTMGPDVNFMNRNGTVDLSAMPFRTDDWMIAGLGRKIRVACIGDSIMCQHLKSHPEWFQADKIHPNAAGARKIAEETFQYLESSEALDPKPLINEFQSMNTDGLQDDDGAYSDWLEISNRGTTGVSPSNCHLSNKLDMPTTLQIATTTVLDPGGRMLIYASVKSRAVVERPLHTNFTHGDGVGSLAMIAPDGSNVIHAYNPYITQLPGESFGLCESNPADTMFFREPINA